MRRMILAAVLLTPALALAGPGLWYQPGRDGHGLSISQPTDGGHAVIWYLYQRDGLATFVIGEPCADFPCVTPLYRPVAGWLGGDLDLGEPIGSLELQPQGDQLRAVFDLRGLDPDQCGAGVSPGGLLFRECAGSITLERLTP